VSNNSLKKAKDPDLVRLSTRSPGRVGMPAKIAAAKTGAGGLCGGRGGCGREEGDGREGGAYIGGGPPQVKCDLRSAIS
jgi:hypothetical protein